MFSFFTVDSKFPFFITNDKTGSINCDIKSLVHFELRSSKILFVVLADGVKFST